MSIGERKARLVSIILSTEADELIEMLEEDVTHYQQGAKDAVDDLSPEELAELKELMEEPAEKDTISFEEFKAEVAQWRKGSL